MIYSIIIGILAGFIASKLMNGEGKGCVVNLLLGLVGGTVGGWIFELLNIEWGGTLGQIGMAVVGAVAVLWLWSKLTKH